MKAGLARMVAGMVLAIFVGSLLFSLYHVASGVTSHESMSGCPFMAHEAVICPMDLVDHIEAWKSTFLAVTPSIVLLLAAAGAILLVASVTPHLVVPKRRTKPILRRQLRERTYSFSYHPLQELFSNGILHPKLF